MKKELSFYDYTLLSKDDQYNLVFTKGEFVGTSTGKDMKFVLYKLCSFFVEVVYNVEDNRIVNISSFMNARS